jgi:hypothetical protein
MASLLRAFALYLAAAALIWAAFSFQRPAHAQGFDAGQHYTVSFLACDQSGHCERMKRPLDADNELNCMLKAGMVGAVQWLKDHPGWRLSEVHCAKDGENDL